MAVNVAYPFKTLGSLVLACLPYNYHTLYRAERGQKGIDSAAHPKEERPNARSLGKRGGEIAIGHHFPKAPRGLKASFRTPSSLQQSTPLMGVLTYLEQSEGTAKNLM